MIHNISIATDDDIIHVNIDDDVKIYPVYSSRAIIIYGKLSSLVRKDHCFRPYFGQFLVS